MLIMYQPHLNMGITEYAVSRAILELQEEHHHISYEMIADRIGGGVSTVGKTVTHMIRCGMLRRVSGSTRAGGYRYVYRGK